MIAHIAVPCDVMHHLREHGLRTIATTPAKAEHKDVEDAEDDENALIDCVDAEFADKAAQIAQSKKVWCSGWFTNRLSS